MAGADARESLDELVLLGDLAALVGGMLLGPARQKLLRQSGAGDRASTMRRGRGGCAYALTCSGVASSFNETCEAGEWFVSCENLHSP